MGTSRGEAVTEDPLSAVTWGVGWVDIRCSRCADPVVPVKCTVSEMVKLVRINQRRLAPSRDSLVASYDSDLRNLPIESERSSAPGSPGSRLPRFASHAVNHWHITTIAITSLPTLDVEGEFSGSPTATSERDIKIPIHSPLGRSLS